MPDSAVATIALGLNLSRAEVHGVVSFYHDFKTHPVGRNTVQICRAEACQSMGSRQLEAHAKAALGIDYHETTADGNITLEPVYCLGNCACSPSVRINDDIVARVDSARFERTGRSTGGLSMRFYIPQDTTRIGLWCRSRSPCLASRWYRACAQWLPRYCFG